jgi:AraC family transcriptional regulator
MNSKTRMSYQRAVELAIAEIVANLDSALDFHELARRAAMSPFHFHRVFRGMVGETPLEMHRRLRLERAAWTLKNDATPVTRVAMDAGYDTHEAFTRVFNSHYGHSPSAYRQQTQLPTAGCARVLDIELRAQSGIHFSPELDLSPLTPHFTETLVMHVNIVTLGSQRVAALRHNGPYLQIGNTFGRLGALCEQAQLLGPESAMVALFYDDPETTPEAELKSDAGMVVSKAAVIPASLSEVALPAGKYAVTVHAGPYRNLPDTWARFMGQWLPQSGMQMGEGTPFEKYLNTPMDTAESELRTELYLPLRSDD